MRLLIVEDEARIVELLSDSLRQAGFVTDAVSRCADALEALSLTPYDAAVGYNVKGTGGKIPDQVLERLRT